MGCLRMTVLEPSNDSLLLPSQSLTSWSRPCQSLNTNSWHRGDERLDGMPIIFWYTLSQTRVLALMSTILQPSCVFQDHGEHLSEPSSACGIRHQGQQHTETHFSHHVKYLAEIMLLIFNTPPSYFNAGMKGPAPCALYCSAGPLNCLPPYRVLQSVGSFGFGFPHQSLRHPSLFFCKPAPLVPIGMTVSTRLQWLRADAMVPPTPMVVRSSTISYLHLNKL